MHARSSVTASYVIVDENTATVRRSGSSHLSKVETVPSKRLSLKLSAGDAGPLGLRTRSVPRSNYPTLTPGLSICRSPASSQRASASDISISDRRAAEVSPFGCSPKRTFSQLTILSAPAYQPFFPFFSVRQTARTAVHRESVTIELPQNYCRRSETRL